MRCRTPIFAFVLLVVSALAAVASAAGSSQTHRKVLVHAHTKSHQTANHPPANHPTANHPTAIHPTAVHPKADHPTADHPKVNHPRPHHTSATPTPPNPSTGTAYEVGYRNGYDAGRAAALKEQQTQTASANPEAEPAAAETTATQTAQIRSEALPEALPKPNDPDASDENDDESGIEMAKLDLPRTATSASLRGSLASLQRQNARLESDGLERILDDDDLNSRIAHKLLTPLPESANLTVNPGLPENRRYCRSWTARFLSDLAKEHAAAFHRPFQVNSAVRTVEYQRRLMRTNGNAAAAEGDVVSPHLTGATIDIGKQGMTHAELLWMRRQLLALQNAGKIDVEEEFEQACFHISVYKSYTAPRPVHKAVQPPLREASAPTTPPTPARRPVSSLPTSIAAGTFTR
jgi:hypothetical protein